MWFTGVLARFVKITAASDQILQVAELAVWTADGVNVAVSKPCTATVPWDPATTCGLALNGGLRAENYPNLYAAQVVGGFMQVDLGGNFNIVRVDYYNRADNDRQRIIGARVELLDASSVVLATQSITTNALITSLSFVPPTTTTAASTTTTPPPGMFS
jgi:hypothetical protein